MTGNEIVEAGLSALRAHNHNVIDHGRAGAEGILPNGERYNYITESDAVIDGLLNLIRDLEAKESAGSCERCGTRAARYCGTCAQEIVY